MTKTNRKEAISAKPSKRQSDRSIDALLEKHGPRLMAESIKAFIEAHKK